MPENPQHRSPSEITGGVAYRFGSDATPGYSYLRNGALASMTYPSGRQFTTTYDDLSRPIGLSGFFNAQQQNYVTGATYTDHGALSSLRLNGQRIRERTAFEPNRLQPINLVTEQCVDNTAACANPQWLLSLGYSYTNGTGTGGGPNNSGNPRSQVIVGAGLTLTQAYTYDGWDRLSAMQETGGSTTLNEGYCYDAFGNRAVSTRPNLSPLIPQVVNCAPADVATLFPQNRLAGRPYDAAGALGFDGSSSLRMDGELRLRQSFSGSPTVFTNYEYDGEGRRVAKETVGGSRTVFVYDAAGQLAAEYGGTQNDLPGTPPYYLHADTLGSTRLTTDANGTVVRRADYWPFGQEINSLTQDAPYRTSGMGYNSGLRTPSMMFTGKERDFETGLDYFGARYLSSAQGRFTNPDAPFADQHPSDPQSWNLYSYVRNRPLKLVDSDGKQSQQALEKFSRLVTRYSSNPGQAVKDIAKVAETFKVLSHLTEVLGSHARNAGMISSLLESQAPGSDGDHDRAVGFLGSLVAPDLVPDGIEKEFFDVYGQRITEVDLETSYALIEVKTRPKADITQANTHVSDRRVNPNRKPVIVYGPELSTRQRREYGQKGVTVVGSIDEFLDFVRRLKAALTQIQRDDEK
ncbi:MAG: RHS repeat-associated core domain-containing protein [Bryobacteraceae bacterium]|nr:RHS repeat-associated core domain-containing protein [Bryobacteraceae bacterium]